MSYFSKIAADALVNSGDIDPYIILEINSTVASWSMKGAASVATGIYHYVEPSIKTLIDQDQRPLIRTIFAIHVTAYKLAILRLLDSDVEQANKLFSSLNEAILSCQVEGGRRYFWMDDVEAILKKINDYEWHLKGLTRMEINYTALYDVINAYGLDHEQSLDLSKYLNKPTVANIFASAAQMVVEEVEPDVPWKA